MKAGYQGKSYKGGDRPYRHLSKQRNVVLAITGVAFDLDTQGPFTYVGK